MTDRLRFFCSDMVTPMRKICIVVFFFLLWGTSGISARAIGARDFLFLRTIGQFRGLYEIRSALDADFAWMFPPAVTARTTVCSSSTGPEM